MGSPELRTLRFSLLLATAMGPQVASGQAFEAPSFCSSRDCINFEQSKATHLCQPIQGSAASWVDDPFLPSVRGVAFYDTFDAEVLVERLGPEVQRSEWISEYEERDPTTPDTVTRVPFHRYGFDQVAVETATIESWDIGTKVTKIEVSGPDVPLRCGLRIGMPWATFREVLGLPDQPVNQRARCSVYYDLYDLPYDRGGYRSGDNSTLCFTIRDNLVARMIWDKTRWASGYH